MAVTEVRGDLFTSSDSLAHCVSRDLHMGKGIATEFKKQFGGIDELHQQSKLFLSNTVSGELIFIYFIYLALDLYKSTQN